MPEPWLSDPDVTLYHGDVLATLRELPAESVDCVVTSPPYWGLRDYGTGQWEGGDAECDHRVREDARIESSTLGGGKSATGHQREGFKEMCPRCGATRVDKQLGLEPTPEQYVERMVEVFREVRRVLAAHGTVWLNLGDSYAQNGGGSWTTCWNPSRKRVSGALKQKDLCGIPWRVAFALQADGWYLRSDIIWSKPNPMPESVTDRPTKAHEYVFLLSKQPRYFFDQEAVREKSVGIWNSHEAFVANGPRRKMPEDEHLRQMQRTKFSHDTYHPDVDRTGRNIRSVWEIATQPYPEAHFATFPEELARRCIAAGCPERVCQVCGKARERMVQASGGTIGQSWHNHEADLGRGQRGGDDGHNVAAEGWKTYKRESLGFTDCGHADYRSGIVLDPFVGSGTTLYVARKLGRRGIGIDLSTEYLEFAARRLQQQSLFAEAT